MVLWATSPPHPPPKVGVPQGATFGPALVAHYAFSPGDPILSHEISCRLENVTSKTYTVGLHLYGIESKVRVWGKKACSLFFQLNNRQGSRLILGVIRKRACFEDQNHTERWCVHSARTQEGVRPLEEKQVCSSRFTVVQSFQPWGEPAEREKVRDSPLSPFNYLFKTEHARVNLHTVLWLHVCLQTLTVCLVAIFIWL